MSEIDLKTRRRAMDAARGLEPFDVLVAGGRVVDVGTGEVRSQDVGVVGPLVASVHAPGARSDAHETLDVDDRYVAPGLVDLHVHFESSMLTPGGYAEAVCPHGTTTVFADPHELANVAGVAGVRYAVDASRGLPVRFLFQAPSCVPPLPGLEVSGADIAAQDVGEMLRWPEMAGLAEVMDMPGVLNHDARMVDVVGAGLASGKLVSGHAAGLTGGDLQAYAAAGVTSDHEILSVDDALEKLRAGLTLEIRGALEFLLPPIVEALNALPMLPTHVVAVTDDLFALTLVEEGGIDHLLRRLVGYGLSPIAALRIATYNAAYRLQRQDLGLVAPGRRADLIVLSDLESVTVDDVFFEGRHVASAGRMLVPVDEAPASPPLESVKLTPMSRDEFQLRVPGVRNGEFRLRVLEGPVLTSWGEAVATVREGVAEVPDGHLLQVAVHRHARRPSDPKVALVSGWGWWSGAIATTVNHDTHNLLVFGRYPDDMAAAANAVIARQGGVAVAKDGQVVARIDLPIAGILSPLPAADVAAAQRQVQEAALAVGLERGFLTQPLFTLMVSSLACLPGPHVTDVGVVDGATGERFDSLLL